MKAGVAVIVSALGVLNDMELLKSIPVKCLINGDEEIGSIHSQPLIRDLAEWASFALVFEGGGLGGEVVYARRGIRRFKLTSPGRRSMPVSGRVQRPALFSSCPEWSRLWKPLTTGKEASP